MNSDYKPSDSDVKTVLEAHSLVPEGPLLDEALGLTSLYVDIIRQVLTELPDTVNRRSAVLAIIEEGLMEDGIIPNSHEKSFEMASFEELLRREGIIDDKRKKTSEMHSQKDEFDKDE